MKLALLCCLVAVVALPHCQGNVLQEKIQSIGDDLKQKGTAMKEDLKAVGNGLLNLTKSKAKSFGSQTFQAVIGAFANAFKGFDLKKILLGETKPLSSFVGKREIVSLGDKWKSTLDAFKQKTADLSGDLKDVGQGLLTVAKSKAKSLASQTLQALVGAVANAFKGFDLGKIIMGKRDLTNFDDVEGLIWGLIMNATEKLDRQFDATFHQFAEAIGHNLQLIHETVGIQAHLDAVAAEHDIAVRGILGDTLNKGIDFMKNLYYKARGALGKAKEAILGGSKSGEVVSDPIMIGRRGILQDAWNKLNSKFQQIKQTVEPHFLGASETVHHVSKMLGYYAGNMIEAAKNRAYTKAQETYQGLKTGLTEHLSNARVALDSFKQQLAQEIQNVINDVQE